MHQSEPPNRNQRRIDQMSQTRQLQCHPTRKQNRRKEMTTNVYILKIKTNQIFEIK